MLYKKSLESSLCLFLHSFIVLNSGIRDRNDTESNETDECKDRYEKTGIMWKCVNYSYDWYWSARATFCDAWPAPK